MDAVIITHTIIRARRLSTDIRLMLISTKIDAIIMAPAIIDIFIFAQQEAAADVFIAVVMGDAVLSENANMTLLLCANTLPYGLAISTFTNSIFFEYF